jgi:hypothetical protein
VGQPIHGDVRTMLMEQIDEADEWVRTRTSWDGDWEFTTIVLRRWVGPPDPIRALQEIT